MRRILFTGLVAITLTACASTQPRATASPTAEVAVINAPLPTSTSAPVTPTPNDVDPTPTSQPEQSAAPSVDTTPTASEEATAVALDENGSVTPSMAQLGIAGERYATLGDPNAPLTIVEYSDFG